MKINQVYNLFGSENLENFIYIQKEFPMIRRGQSSDIWMGIVQIRDYFHLMTSKPLSSVLQLSVLQGTSLRYLHYIKGEVNQINSSHLLSCGRLVQSGIIKHPPMWAHAHTEKNPLQST